MENFLADLLREFARQGVEAPALVHDHRPRLRANATRESVNGVESERLVSPRPKSIRIYRAPSLGQMLYAPVSPQFPVCLRQVIRAEQPKILHLHLPNPSAFWAMALPEARRITWVVHWHADVVASDHDRRMKLAYPVYRQFEQRFLDRADAVIVTSPPYLAKSRALAPWRDKCRVTPLGLDPSRIPDVSDDEMSRAERAWGNASIRVLSVGRLTYYKGFEYLIEAMAGVPGGRAIIVGQGERRRYLERTISELNLAKRVVLAGSQASERLHALMETCDCLCLPSIERTEAFGMVLLEAMAHRKPTVVCDISGSGVGWVVRDGKTGMVVPPANPAALSEALRTLAADRRMSVRMGRQGWQRYHEMFRMARVSGDIVKLYENVLEGRGEA